MTGGTGPGERGPVPPGSGWPEDPAAPDTPVARSPDEVGALAASAREVGELDARTAVCRACPRLVAWREEVAAVRRAAFAQSRYWGRPVPSWGPPDARILIVGLAPAAHGGNRTGRIFTGDRSGDVLFASLHRAGLAALPTSVAAGDGQRLLGARVVAAVHCAPPANAPDPAERDACRPWLVRDLELVRPTLRVIVVLGGFAWQALWPALAAAGFTGAAGAAGTAGTAGTARTARTAGVGRRPAFGHGTAVTVGAPAVTILGCYHPSQQNTFTGRLTPAMLDAVFGHAARLAELPEPVT